ncbi:hypothetical protein ACFQZI_16790 [Mucilaginibacter lutimaris]|uniref:Uncharacterized protein n=1 Tax=Mucilaginibacter lutimaris TaxID=931629 RepID=A0ABW2ZJW6_9SPHI
MKAFINYISLLLFSGLILLFYNTSIHKNDALSAIRPISAINKTRAANPGHTHSFIYQDVVEILLPQLIN